MKNFKSLILVLALSAVACFGQTVTLSSTTLGAAITSNTATTITLASTSTMLSQGPANQINTAIYVDKEYMRVITVVDSTHVIVSRHAGLGWGGRPANHVNGAKVYFANTTNGIPAESFFTNGSNISEASGACTAATEMVLPRIYVNTADIFDCKSSGTWLLLGQGSLAAGGAPVRAFCTGTVGSAETTFLNGAACSGGTTATARYVIGSAGTLANLYIASSANSLGTGGTVATVLKNGVATAIICSPAAATKVCSDTTHSVSVLPGDLITFSYLSSTSDTAANISAVASVY